MKSYPCDGAPHGPTGDLGEFGASGQPKNLNHESQASLTDGADTPPSGPNPKQALAEKGGLAKATKSSNLAAAGVPIEIPGEGGEDPANLKL